MAPRGNRARLDRELQSALMSPRKCGDAVNVPLRGTHVRR